MSQTKDNIYKLIAQIKATATSLQADPSDMDEVEKAVSEEDYTEEELLKIQQKLMQTLKDLLIIQDDLTKKLQTINDEMTQVIQTTKHRQAEEEDRNDTQKAIEKIKQNLNP
jgi:hypothetical protein